MLNELNKTWLKTRPQLDCGLFLRTPTLRDIATLDEIRNPIGYGLPPLNRGQLLAFLWLLSEDFSVDEGKQQEWLNKWDKAISDDLWSKEIADWWLPVVSYMKCQESKEPDSSVASYIAYYVYTFASEFGWDVDYILDRPIMQIYQLLKVHRQRLGIADYVPEYERLVKELQAEKKKNPVN